MSQTPPNDDSRPVVLEEPQRPVPPQWNEDFALRPEEAPRFDLHPGWAAILAAGETPLWQGQTSADPRLGFFDSLAARPMRTAIIAVIALLVFLNIGLDPVLVPMVLVVLFLIFRQGMHRIKAGVRPDRRYLLTNRAAYLARAQGQALHDIQAFPITATMQLGLGPRSVAFAVRRNAKGEEEAEGFLDIAEAATVHTLIRDLQKGAR